jgi:Ca-activated chloride channel family protein
MNFGHPLLLLTLLVIPAGFVLYRVAVARRRMPYAVRYTNVDVLASVVATGKPWRRWIAAGVFLLALATLCVAVSRPRVHHLVASDNATVVLVLDVSGSMQAIDVKPTRLVAAQRALHTFLDKVPPRLKVGLILFAGEAQVATPPTTDHGLVSEAIDEVDFFHGFGGTAIGDALATAVQVGLRSVGVHGNSVTALPQRRALAAYVTAPKRPASTLVTILFLSDGHQTRGILRPLQGADRARAAGIPVYTISLGTTGNTTMRGYPQGFPGNTPLGGGGGFGRRGLAPDPKTLRAIAARTGGKFFRAKTAGSAKDAYASLGSELGRKPGTTEVTDLFLIGAAVLLVLSGALSAIWSPRLP